MVRAVGRAVPGPSEPTRTHTCTQPSLGVHRKSAQYTSPTSARSVVCTGPGRLGDGGSEEGTRASCRQRLSVEPGAPAPPLASFVRRGHVHVHSLPVLSLLLAGRSQLCPELWCAGLRTPPWPLSGPGAEVGVTEGAELEASHSVRGYGCSWVSRSGRGAAGAGSPRSLGLETERGRTRVRRLPSPPPVSPSLAPPAHRGPVPGDRLLCSVCCSPAASEGGRLGLPPLQDVRTLCHLPRSSLFWAPAPQVRGWILSPGE